MEFLIYLAAFLLVKGVQKSLQFSPHRAKWSSLLTIAQWATIALALLAIVYFHQSGKLLIGSILLGAMVYFGDQEPDLSHLHAFFKAHYPLVAAGALAGLTVLIAPVFYENQSSYFNFAIVGAFVWIFARRAASKRQQKEFDLVSQQNMMLDKLVAERTAELTNQKNELQQTLVLLQTTQQQLIQSEKLASLGELTAGIAHEIQNPLNFVNNFSEVSMELVDEMADELSKGDKDEAMAIAGDIKQNLEKIIHHGKRADGIVKGMLQHSRASNGIKELTDINALADEYLRLAFHGLRAKDKSFNADLVTHFEAGMPKINVVPQDIGRVLLNLFTNAFFAVQKMQAKSGAEYKPTIELSTSANNDFVKVKVKDNGTGIPDELKDKIMQPFFTTKPTGEGTGLGLSISYDIIVKGHNGQIEVSSKENEYTEFIIILPIA
jgi:signal transduction histidine kinase